MRRSQGDEKLTAYLLGELSASEAAEVEARLLVDEEAAAEVESLRGTVGMLGAALAEEELPALGEERRQLIVAGPAQMRISTGNGRGWRVKVAAALVIGLGGVVITKQMIQRSGMEPAGLVRVAEKNVRPAQPAEAREALAREHGAGAFVFVGETSPVIGSVVEPLAMDAGPVMLSLHTVSADLGDPRIGARMASVPRLLDDTNVATRLREQYRTGGDDLDSEDRLNTNVFRFQ